MSSMLFQPEVHSDHDFLPITGTDYLELYVGNARQAAYFYRAAFGMSLVAYAGPETGRRDRASYVLQQGKVRFVLTTALRSDSDIARHGLYRRNPVSGRRRSLRQVRLCGDYGRLYCVGWQRVHVHHRCHDRGFIVHRDDCCGERFRLRSC